MESGSSRPNRVIAVDAETATSGLAVLADRLSEALAAGADVTLDLARLERIDSSVLMTIVAADKTARAAGRRLLLRGLRADAARTLAQTGLDRRLEILDRP